MTTTFRCEIVLMVLGHYKYGQHVSDPSAFALRCRALLSRHHAALRGERPLRLESLGEASSPLSPPYVITAR